MTTLTPGQKAPHFSLESDTGESISLKNLRGKKVVLYFYPKDNTPGCTKQACEYTDLHKKFLSKNTVVLGVSRDSVASHQKFREKQGLGFPLLSDPDHQMHEAYGAWGKKMMYGKEILGAIRTTVVIDEEGKIVSYEKNVKAEGNALKTLTLLESCSR